jgi:hypothetical protein
VAVSGDTAVVGAPNADDGVQGPGSGLAYVFERNWGGVDNWGQVSKLTASDGAAGDNFGWSVSIDGNTLVVGAPFDTVSGDIYHGSAYIFQWRTVQVYLPLVLRSVAGGEGWIGSGVSTVSSKVCRPTEDLL